MKAIIINRYGPSKELKLVENYPTPKVRENQVLLKVKAAGINPLDWKIRNGLLKPIFGNKFPMVLGNDLSGEIVLCGKNVKKFKKGDLVYCMSDSYEKPAYSGFAKPGAYAEFVVTREDTLAIKPTNITHNQAAVVPLCALTAYQALITKGNIKKGDKVLINGASGGVGIFACQLALFYGADVTAVCGEKSIDKLKNLGVKNIIDYKKMDITNLQERFDIIYDVAANHKLYMVKPILKKSGLFISNVAPVIVFLIPLLRKINRLGRFAFVWVQPSGENLIKISGMINNGEIKPIIDKIFNYTDVSIAHDYCEKGGGFGKVVISL